MSLTTIFKRLIVAVSLMILSVTVFAQDSTSADGLFQMARKAALGEKNYPKAIVLSKKALFIAPGYSDIRIFLGRIYTWSNQYDSAKAAFEYVLGYAPENEDASAAYTDLEYWNDHRDAALIVADKGLQYHPASEVLLLKKTKVLVALRRFKEAAILTNKILAIDRNNAEARALAERIKEMVAKNSVGVSYDLTTFDKQFSDAWHMTSINYGRQTKLGSVTARVSFANRFKQSGTQYELDMYPRISKTFYSYVSFGYSGDQSVFPQYRGGLSLYINLPKRFEAELGTRYLRFTDDTWIYTFYLGRYYKSFLFGARTYLAPSSNNISQSYNLMARYYYGSTDDYLHFNIGTGISPDDRSNTTLLNSNYKLKSYRASVSWKKSFGILNIFSLDVGWVNTEYLLNTKGNQYNIGIGYQRRF
jgi:YaiO family outer membrane protein